MPRRGRGFRENDDDPIKGPAQSDPNGYILLTTEKNPMGSPPLEWSNVLAYVLPHARAEVECDSARRRLGRTAQPPRKGRRAAELFAVDLEIRPFFEDDSAVISRAFAKAGELTQGLCSPWQNDYRECSCYYWASARPDFVNVETEANGLSTGDNWFQRKRTGSYVPDDYADSRLVMYDELFRDWETVLKFQIGGRDAKDARGSVEGKVSLADARRVIGASAPRAPQAHLIETALGRHLFVADGSRLFDAGLELFARCETAMASEASRGPSTISFGASASRDKPFIDDKPLEPSSMRALSLAIAQKCNLGCVYCYAEQGDFGSAPKNMSIDDALRAVDLLVEGAEPGASLNLAFLGGEPLVNRPALREATRRARAQAQARGAEISFSITTNGTLLTEDDGRFFEEFGFALTISLDGPREQHDALRPFKGGDGSFDATMRRVEPLLRMQRAMQVTARVTVTPSNLALRRTLDEFIAAGFYSVGFSPMLSAPGGKGEMHPDHLERMLGEMIDCGREYERRTRLGQCYPFANMVNAMREIHRGTHRPYPCGAGAGYLGVSADGDLAACHRFVGDPDGAMGSLAEGPDLTRRRNWLAARHVHRQEPCGSCWARYLCGGGCHHEVLRRGRPACDYIRGWLHYCLEAYLRLPPHTVAISSGPPAAYG